MLRHSPFYQIWRLDPLVKYAKGPWSPVCNLLGQQQTKVYRQSDRNSQLEIDITLPEHHTNKAQTEDKNCQF